MGSIAPDNPSCAGEVRTLLLARRSYQLCMYAEEVVLPLQYAIPVRISEIVSYDVIIRVHCTIFPVLFDSVGLVNTGSRCFSVMFSRSLMNEAVHQYSMIKGLYACILL